METEDGARQAVRKGLRFLSSQGALLAAAALVLASTLAAGSGTLASFQAQTTNPGNVFSAGILRMTNVSSTGVSGTDCTTDGTTGGVLSGSCKTLVNTSLRVPGDATSNTVKIKNVGNVDGQLTLHLGTVTAGNASTPAGNIPACGNTSGYPAQLALTVTDGTAANDISGTLSSKSGTDLFATRTVAANTENTYTVGLTFNSTGSSTTDNPLQNCSAPFELTWTLVQRAANLTSTPNASGSSS